MTYEENEIKKLNALCEEYRLRIKGFERAVDAGCGNVEQAVREFAEELKIKLNERREFYLDEYEWDSASTMLECTEIVDDLIKERFGDDQK